MPDGSATYIVAGAHRCEPPDQRHGGADSPHRRPLRQFAGSVETKPVGAGSGLGLSMIYGFAKQSGGQVKIRSEEGAGTRVYLQLPSHAAQPPSLIETRG
ncbi:hypothetical protein E8E68_26845 [Pseudomonas sp. BN607]|nr:hypothetical protein [Pseudomonas sp. BN607]